MSCAAHVFADVTDAHFDRILAKVTKAGLRVEGHAGEAKKAGFSVRWHFEPHAQRLTLQCTGRPFFISCEQVRDGMCRLVDGCQVDENV